MITLARLSGAKAPPWTEAGMNRLRLRWSQGMPTDEIARELDRSLGAVTARASLLGLPRRTQVYDCDDSVKRNSFAELPPDCRYADDPRAVTDTGLMPAAPRGDVTAAYCGDPVPGRSAA